MQWFIADHYCITSSWTVVIFIHLRVAVRIILETVASILKMKTFFFVSNVCDCLQFFRCVILPMGVVHANYVDKHENWQSYANHVDKQL